MALLDTLAGRVSQGGPQLARRMAYAVRLVIDYAAARPLIGDEHAEMLGPVDGLRDSPTTRAH